MVPDDRVLVESDWHSEGEVRWRQVEDITRIVIRTKGWGVEEGVEILERNFWEFVRGDDLRSMTTRKI